MELFALSGERCRTKVRVRGRGVLFVTHALTCVLKEAEQVRPAELLSRLSAFSSKNIEILVQ